MLTSQTVIERPATPALPAATLEEFEAVLRRHQSATLALEEWCTVRGLGNPARVTAHLVAEPETQASAEIRERLGLTGDETVAMRHVELRCGERVLSEAWNWYVPGLLAPDMRTALERTDVPFGKAVAALKFRRVPFAEAAGAAAGCPAGTISTHRAMLVLPDGRPLAYLIECYTSANLDG